VAVVSVVVEDIVAATMVENMEVAKANTAAAVMATVMGIVMTMTMATATMTTMATATMIVIMIGRSKIRVKRKVRNIEVKT
jgi:hypothetical protein